MALLEIEEIQRAEAREAGIRGFCLDTPRPGVPVEGSVLRLEGWVLPAKEPIHTIQVFCQGALLREMGLDRPRPDVVQHFGQAPEACGFGAALSVFELPPVFHLELMVSFHHAARVFLAAVRGKQSVTPVGDGQLLRPLMITSRGRCGTTYLMRLLADHPAIVAERLYPYESRAAVYWMHLLRVLTQPGAAVPEAAAFARGQWPAPPYVPPPAVGSPLLSDYVRESYPRLAAEFCRSATDDFYRRAAAAQQQPGALYFCEKFPPSGIQTIVWNLYSEARELFLVRDFRDMVCSVFAFNARRGVVGFGREESVSDEAYILSLRDAVRSLLESFRSRSRRARLVRYEDLVFAPRKTLRSILRYLGLEAGEKVLLEMIQGAARDTPDLRRHRTSASPEESIGRWSADLPPALEALCRESFDELLPEFGYQLDSCGRLVMQNKEMGEP